MMATTTSALAAAPSIRGTAVADLAALLDQTADLLVTLDVDTYCAHPAAQVSGSVGEHVRHLLDHVVALVTATPERPLSYDRRERGGSLERDPDAAIEAIGRVNGMLRRWIRAVDGDEPIAVQMRLAGDGTSETAWSTRTREVAFVISHTIHHQALIAFLLAGRGIGVPPRFGFAPSTPARG